MVVVAGGLNPRMVAAARLVNMQRAARAQAQAQAQAQARRVPSRGVRLGPVSSQRVQQQVRDGSGGIDWQALTDVAHEQSGRGRGGGGNPIGNVIGAIGKGAGAALNALDYGRRFAISGLKEGADLTAELFDEGPGTRLFGTETDEASWSDFWSQTNDKSFGFGDITGDIAPNEGIGKWINRAVGLGGDVAFDPLTYLTFGASKIPGATGRVSLARAAERAGLAPEVIERVGRLGGNAITDVEQRVAMGLKPQRGMEFMGLHIPGTGRVAGGGSAAINALKTAGPRPLIDSRMAQYMRRWGVSRLPETREAMEVLATGRGPVGAASRHLSGFQGGQAAQRMTEGTLGREAVQIGDELGDNPQWTHAWEAGDLSNPAVARAKELSDAAYEFQTGKLPSGAPSARFEDRGVSVGYRENRVPHVLTPEGMEVFGKDMPPGGVGGRAKDAPQGSQFERRIEPGKKYKIGGHTFEPVEGTIKEANEWAASVGLPKLYEDSPKYLAALMVEQAGGAVATARYWKELAAPGRYKQAYGTTDNFASEMVANVPGSKLLGKELKTAKARAKALDKYRTENLAGPNWKYARAEAKATDIYKQIKDQWIASTKADLDKAKGLDREAQKELNDALRAADKLGTPAEAHAAVVKKAEELHARATKKLEAAQARFERAESRLAEFEASAQRRSGAARKAAEAERDRALAKLQEATDTARRRSAVRQRLGRAEVKQERLAAAQSELEALVPSETPVAKVRQAEPTVPTAPAPTPPPATTLAPGDLVAGDRYLPELFVPEFNKRRQAFEVLKAKADETGDPQDILRSNAAAKDTREFFNRRAKPVPEQAPPPAAVVEPPPAAVTEPVTPPEPTGPPPQVIADLEAAQAATKEGAANVKALTKEKGKLDTQFGKQAEARKINPDEVAAKAEERIRSIEEPLEGQRAKITERVVKERDAVREFAGEVAKLDAKTQADLKAIQPMFENADQRIIDAANDKGAMEFRVRQQQENAKRARTMRTAPEQGTSWEDLAAANRQRVGRTIDPLTGQVVNANLDPKTIQLLDAADAVVKTMAKHDADANLMYKFAKDLRSGKLTTVMERVAKDGYKLEQLDRQIGKDLYVRTEMLRMKNNFVRQARKEPGAIGKAIDSYTKFFKAWATATPGFHIRNAMSATFMNMTEGVAAREMMDGVRIWQAFRKNPMGPWVESLPKELQHNAKQVVEAVYASGAGGRFSAEELSQRAFANRQRRPDSKLVENRWTRKSQAWGERVEGSVRAGLALHSLNEGDNFATAVTRLKRTHFDYSDVNETDEAIRRAVPFWTFMSRNLPLQVQQMWMKPRTYAHYNSLVRNFTDDGEAWMPDWMEAEGAFNIGPGLALAPDVGATQIQEQFAMLREPMRFGGSLNPMFKVAGQLATGKDFYYGEDFKDADYQKMGVETRLLAPLLEAVGLAESTPQGPVMERKFQNAIYDLVPILAQINRLGSTTPNREGKRTQTVANLIGVPVRIIDPEGERKELQYKRRSSRYPSDEERRMEALRQFR